MRLEDDPSIGFIPCPWCGQPAGIPCKPPDDPDDWRKDKRKYIPSHMARMVDAAYDDLIGADDKKKLLAEIDKRRRSKYKDWNQTRGRMQR